MAMIHAIRGQHGRAIADFARAISLDPFFAVAHFQLGVSAFLLGQYKEARKSFDRCLKVRGTASVEDPTRSSRLILSAPAISRKPHN